MFLQSEAEIFLQSTLSLSGSRSFFTKVSLYTEWINQKMSSPTFCTGGEYAETRANSRADPDSLEFGIIWFDNKSMECLKQWVICVWGRPLQKFNILYTPKSTPELVIGTDEHFCADKAERFF